MSTKTLRKRIALVAVSAMGFGLLTSVAGNAHTAGDIQLVAKTAQPGVCDVTDTSGSQDISVVTGKSFKVQGRSGGSGAAVYVSVSGNISIGSAGSEWDTVTLTTAYSPSLATTNATDEITLTAGAVGTGKITMSDSDSGASEEVISVSVVASCESNVWASTYSKFKAATSISGAPDTNVDDTTSGLPATTIGNGSAGYISFVAKDAYGNLLPSGKVMIATVKSGDAFVAIANTSTTTITDGTTKTAYATSTASAVGSVEVIQSVANKPTTAVVEVTYDGAVIGTRTFTFEGAASKITVSDVTVGKTSSFGYYRFRVQDAAGNYLRSISIDNDAAVTDGAIVSDAEGDTAAATGSLGEKSAASDGTNPAKFLCTGKGGSGTAGIKYRDPKTLEYVKASFTAICAGSLDTWALSLDKASYQPGEIATLTVTGKDANGNLVNSNEATPFAAVTQSFGGMTFVTAPTTTDKFSSGLGTKTYTLTVGTTEGSYVGTFKIAGTTDTAAKTIQYKVAAGGSSVTNAEVLSAIVKLIASINKQITALQKLILKKK